MVNDVIEERKEEEIQMRMINELCRLRQQTRTSVSHTDIFRAGMIIKSVGVELLKTQS